MSCVPYVYHKTGIIGTHTKNKPHKGRHLFWLQNHISFISTHTNEAEKQIHQELQDASGCGIIPPGTNRPKHLIKLFQRKWLWDEQWSVLGKAMKVTFYMLPPHVISITAGHDLWTNFGWPYNLTYKPQAEQTHLNLGGRFLKSAERRQSRTGREEVSPL